MQRILVLSVVMVMAAGLPASATKIERACLQADRDAANRTLCGCIQDVADMSLSKAQQAKGARFFKDPQKAQDVRQSGRRADRRFWEAWERFAAMADEFCGSAS